MKTDLTFVTKNKVESAVESLNNKTKTGKIRGYLTPNHFFKNTFVVLIELFSDLNPGETGHSN